MKRGNTNTRNKNSTAIIVHLSGLSKSSVFRKEWFEWITLLWDKLLVFTEAVGGVSDTAQVVYEEKSFKCIRFNNNDSDVLNIAMRLT